MRFLTSVLFALFISLSSVFGSSVSVTPNLHPLQREHFALLSKQVLDTPKYTIKHVEQLQSSLLHLQFQLTKFTVEALPSSCSMFSSTTTPTTPTMDLTAVQKCFMDLGIQYPTSCVNIQTNPTNLMQCMMDLQSAIIPIMTGGTGGLSPAGPSQTCMTTITTLSLNIANKCGALATTIGSSIGGATDASSIIANQCSVLTGTTGSDCFSLLSSTSLQNALAQCAGTAYDVSDIIGSGSSILSALAPIKGLCVKDGQGGYCISSLFNSMSSIGGDIFGNPSAVSDSLVNNMCKPCVSELLKNVASYGTGSNSVASAIAAPADIIGLFCLRDPVNPSSFCLSSLKSLISGKTDITNMDSYCSPCAKAIVNKLTTLASSSSSSFLSPAEATQFNTFSSILPKLCTREPTNGKRCIVSLLDQLTNLKNDPNVLAKYASCMTMSGTTCDATCATNVNALFSSLGCCLNTVSPSTLADLASQDSTANNFGSILKKVIGTCSTQINTGLKCAASTASISMTLNLPNLKYDFTQNNKVSVTSALVKDIAQAFGISSTDITLGPFTVLGKNGVTVTVSVSVDAASKSQYQSSINNQVTSGVPLAQTASLDSSSKINPSEPATATGTVVGGSGLNSGAYAVGASVATFGSLVASLVALYITKRI